MQEKLVSIDMVHSSYSKYKQEKEIEEFTGVYVNSKNLDKRKIIL